MINPLAKASPGGAAGRRQIFVEEAPDISQVPVEIALRDKLFAAERQIAGIRLLVILSGTVIYPFFLDKAGTQPLLAYSLLALAWLYGFYVYFAQPYRKYPLLLSAYFTTATDASFTMAWLYATGGFQSPFYVALYMAVVAVAFRFGTRETAFAAFVYAGAYVGLVAILDQVAANVGDLLVRVTYLFLAAALGAVVSKEVLAQERGRVESETRMAETKNSEIRFRKFIEQSPDAKLLINSNGRIELSNRAVERLFGVSPTEIIGQSVSRLVPDAVNSGVDAGLAPAVPEVGGSTAPARRRTLARRNDGTQFPIEVLANQFEMGGGRFTDIVIHDLTDRERAENEVHASEARWRSLVEYAPDWIFAVDAAGTIAYVNRKFGGREVVEVRGTRLLDQFLPQYRQSLGDVLRDVFKTGGIHAFELEGQDQDGARHWYEAHLGPVRSNHVVNDAIMVVSDTTNRKQAEQALRVSEARLSKSQEIAHIGAWEWDVPANRVTWSDEMYRIYGYEVGAFPVTFEKAMERVAPEDRPRIEKNVADAFHAGRSQELPEVEYRIRWPDGRTRILNGRGRLVVGSDGKPTRMVGTVQDITERRQLEEDRLEALEKIRELDRLKEMDRFKTQFINMAAHELATPLTPMVLQIHLLKSTHPPLSGAERQRALDILDRNTSRLVLLIRDVMDAARLQAARLGIQKEVIDLSAPLKEAAESFNQVARAAGLKLESHVEDGLLVHADSKRLVQVMFNLLDNAMKFTPAGGRVVVQARRDDGQVVVSVQDTGAGMTADQMAKLFQPFSQVHFSQAPELGLPIRRGTGLGLFISKGIVELHGGRIWVESRGPSLGSTFAFELTLAHRPRRPPVVESLGRAKVAFDGPVLAFPGNPKND